MNWRRSLIGAGLSIPLIALFAIGLRLDPRDIASPLPGRPAPDFALPVMSDGEAAPDTVRLSALRGDVVVLNFWASWCLACIDEHEDLSRVARMYEGKGVRFFGILYNDTPPNARRFITRLGGQSYPTLLDHRTRTAIEYGLRGVPETFFIGPDGRVAARQVGPVTTALLVERIEALLEAAGAGGSIPDEAATGGPLDERAPGAAAAGA